MRPRSLLRIARWESTKGVGGIDRGAIAVAVAALAFVLAVGNLTIPQFLSGGERTVTMLVYEEVQRGLHYPNAAAMSIALLVVIFGFVFALFRFVDITDIAQG